MSKSTKAQNEKKKLSENEITYQAAPGLKATTIYSMAFDDDAYTEYLQSLGAPVRKTQKPAKVSKSSAAAPSRLIEANYYYDYDFSSQKNTKSHHKGHKSSSTSSNPKRHPVHQLVSSITVNDLQQVSDKYYNPKEPLVAFTLLTDELERKLLSSSNFEDDFWTSFSTPISDADHKLIEFIINWINTHLDENQQVSASSFLVDNLLQNALKPVNGSKGLGFRLMSQILMRENPKSLLLCLSEVKRALNSTPKGKTLKKPFDQVCIHLGGQLLASHSLNAALIYFVEILGCTAALQADSNLIAFGLRCLQKINDIDEEEATVTYVAIKTQSAIDFTNAMLNSKHIESLTEKSVEFFSKLLEFVEQPAQLWLHYLSILDQNNKSSLLLPLLNGVCFDEVSSVAKDSHANICSVWQDAFLQYPEQSTIIMDALRRIWKNLSKQSQSNLKEVAKKAASSLPHYTAIRNHDSNDGDEDDTNGTHQNKHKKNKKHNKPKIPHSHPQKLPSDTSDQVIESIQLFCSSVGVPYQKAVKRSGRNAGQKTCCSSLYSLIKTILFIAILAYVAILLWNSTVIPAELKKNTEKFVAEKSKLVQPYCDQASALAKPYVDQTCALVKPYVDQACSLAKPYVDQADKFIQPYREQVCAVTKPYWNQACNLASQTWKDASPHVNALIASSFEKLSYAYTKGCEVMTPYVILLKNKSVEAFEHSKPLANQALKSAEPYLQMAKEMLNRQLTMIGKWIDESPAAIQKIWDQYLSQHVTSAIKGFRNLTDEYTMPVWNQVEPYVTQARVFVVNLLQATGQFLDEKLNVQ